MQNQYTRQAKEVLKAAWECAKANGHPYVGTEHLLYGLKKIFTGVASQVLNQNGLKEQDMLEVMSQLVSTVGEQEETKTVKESPRLTYILEESRLEAMRFREEIIGTEHMLLAMIRDTECVGTKILVTLNMNLQKICQDILAVIGQDPKVYAEETSAEGGRKDAVLDQFGTDLTAEAAEFHHLDPVIGREHEIQRLMQILSRRTKNNPCLIGEPGVGKTAIIEGLANLIAQGNVPENMKDKRIFNLDLASVIAGSKYRGEFEERMKRLVREVKSAGNIILFLDEIHTVVGAGGAEGTLDASNILKPSLARGEIQLIGATTITEYRKYIEKDAALERRFQPVMVEEPSQEQCLEILKGVKDRYEAHHRVTIQDDALQAAVTLSTRYINDRFLPDKAIDVMDEACSAVAMRSFKVPENIQIMEEKMQQLKEEKEALVRIGNIEEAAKLHKEQESLEKKWKAAKNRLERKEAASVRVVGEEAIAQVIASWTRIPIQKLAQTEAERLRKLEHILQKRVIGQEEAVTAVAKAVKRGRVGLKAPGRPIGSFLFLGPTGVGKTELSKALAEALFGSEEALIRIDMSEYMEKHSVSKMIGSPPGYVGHEEGGQLSEKVRRHPYSVVLFDEIEKAHPDVFNILLQVLDDGHITDSQGRKVNFSNTVIIMTSNTGAKSIMEPKKLGFTQQSDEQGEYNRMKSNVMEEVKQVFRPEFLNRIDEISVFHPLNEKHMKKIVGLLCKELEQRVKAQMNISLTVRDSVKKHLVETGTDKKYGARPLRRAVQSKLEDALAEAVLNGEVKAGMRVTAGLSKKEIKFTPEERKN